MNLMNVAKTAAYLSIAKSTLHHWISQGCIPVLPPVHRIRLFDQAAIDHWVRNGSPQKWHGLINDFYAVQDRLWEEGKRARDVLTPTALRGY